MSQSPEVAGNEAVQSRAVERFLDAIRAEAALPAHVTPVEAAVVAASALFDRLTVGQAHEVVSALPAEVRPLFEHSFADRETRPVSRIGRAELVDRVADKLGVAPVSAEAIVAAVFHALGSLLPREQIAHVTQQLPHDLQDLWLSSPTPALTEDIGSEPELLQQLLHDIEKSGVLPTRVSARAAFASVMCLFGERLSGGEARRLLLGLPRTVRPLVTRCLIGRRERSVTFNSTELTALVAADLDAGLGEAEAIIAAVLAAVVRILPHEELDHVASQLPEDLRRLWSAERRAPGLSAVSPGTSLASASHMATVYRIQVWSSGWGVFTDGEEEAVEPFRTQGDAVAHAKELARHFEGGAQILVYSENGKLVSDFFYQREERDALRGDDAVASVAAFRPVTRRAH